MKKILVPAILLTSVLIGTALAQQSSDSTEREVRRQIVDDYAYLRENLRDQENKTAQGGALEFWSSGGLLQELSPDDPIAHYDRFTVQPKHIRVKTLAEGRAAVAMYYAEGAMTPKGGAPTDHYLTRVTQVWVNEGGTWKIAAAHFSPVTGGGGTTQSAMQAQDD